MAVVSKGRVWPYAPFHAVRPRDPYTGVLVEWDPEDCNHTAVGPDGEKYVGMKLDVRYGKADGTAKLVGIRGSGTRTSVLLGDSDTLSSGQLSKITKEAFRCKDLT